MVYEDEVVVVCYDVAVSVDSYIFFFFNDTATTEIYTLSLHDALPISLSRHILTYREVAEKRRETGDDQPLDQIYSTPPPAKTAAQGTDDVEHEVCINCTTSLSCH